MRRSRRRIHRDPSYVILPLLMPLFLEAIAEGLGLELAAGERAELPGLRSACRAGATAASLVLLLKRELRGSPRKGV